MRSTFTGYYRPDAEDLKKLWHECVFVLDTSVLLNLYRYPKNASADLLRAFSEVKDRLWVPYQAALEYQENRLTVIAEQLSKFGEVRSILSDSQNGLRTNLEKLQLKRRHSSIATDTFLDKIAKVFEEFTQTLGELEKGQLGVSDPDPLREAIDALLDGRIGPRPEDQTSLDKIYKEGERRYMERRPPGYMDDGKKGSYSYADLSFQQQFGDLVLWEQIIEEASKRKLKYLTLITDDEKEDWWWNVDSRGKKTVGPRPELMEEIKRRGGVSVFYMYSSERFLSYAAEYLGTKVRPDTIDQVREISQQARLEEGSSDLLRLNDAIAEQLREINAGFRIMGTPPERPAYNALQELETRGQLPPGFRSMVITFYSARNRLVHGLASFNSNEFFQAITLGEQVLQTLKTVPRTVPTVYRTHIPIWKDRDRKSQWFGYGVLLQMAGQTEPPRLHIFPTTRNHFREGMRVAWEWSTENQWDEAWYLDPDTQEVKTAWSESLEFVGRALEDIPV